MSRAMPAQRPGKSVQEVATPPALIHSALGLLGGNLAWDLAATSANALAQRWLGPGSGLGENALEMRWHRLACARGDWLWLNPPFGDIGPWAAKCAAEAWLGAAILLLVPASVGAEWFADYVHGKAEPLALTPRVTFVGHAAPYPKDCLLCVYRPGALGAELRPWHWKAAS